MTNKFNIDSDAIKALADLLNSTGLNEIEYEVEAGRIRVAKDTVQKAAVVSAPVSGSEAMRELREDGPPSVSSKMETDHPGAVKSPMVGTAYLASAPEAQPFIKIGDTVSKGDTLLIIEAMKVMNPIRSPQAGQIKNIAVKDAEPVEFGTVLVVIE